LNNRMILYYRALSSQVSPLGYTGYRVENDRPEILVKLSPVQAIFNCSELQTVGNYSTIVATVLYI
jgi:hypothetical protein